MIIANINGTIGNDANVRVINSTKNVLTFSVAAGKKKISENEYETIWVKCVKFYNTDNAPYNLDSLIKGNKISVSGKIEIESYISKTNEFKAVLKLYIDHYEISEKNILDQSNNKTNLNQFKTEQSNKNDNSDLDFPF